MVEFLQPHQALSLAFGARAKLAGLLGRCPVSPDLSVLQGDLGFQILVPYFQQQLILLDAVAFLDMQRRHLPAGCRRKISAPASFNRTDAGIGYRRPHFALLKGNNFNINKFRLSSKKINGNKQCKSDDDKYFSAR